MNLQERIRKVLRETLESEWNTGNEHGNKYDYQHGFCHYFAYNIIDKIKKRYPKKKVNYYLLLANEVDIEDETIVQEYLIHVYIQIDNILLDSNGITTKEEAWQMAQEWEQRQSHLVPENYKTEIWDEESNEIPEYFFNNQFCNTKRVKEDMKKFLSHPTIEKLLNDTIGESKESIRKVLREETEIPLFLRRRFTKEDLDWIVNDVKELIEFGESIDTAVYDRVREFIKSKKFKDIDEFGNDQDYWDSYLKYERPMVKYVKSVLGIDDGEINLQEHIRKVLREETSSSINQIRRRLNAVDWLVDFSVKEIERQYNGICNVKTSENFLQIVIEKTGDGMYWDYFAERIDEDSKEWGEMYRFISEYVNDKFGDKLREHYHIKCGD